MATVQLIFNKKKKTKEGLVPFYLRIIKDRKAKEVSLGIKIHIDDWDFEKNRVRKSEKNYQEINHLLTEKLAEAQALTMNLESENKYVRPKKIRNAILGLSTESFTKFAERNVAKLEKQGKIGTWAKEKAILAKLKKYANEKELSFFDMDVAYITKYEDHLRDKLENAVNTIHTNLKFIRKLFNQAVREEILPIEMNTFLRYKIKREQVQKDFLTDEELQKLEELELAPDIKLNQHRNLFIFATYSGGIRISDLLQLKWQNYNKGKLFLKITKTNDQLTIKLPDKAMEILNFYKKPDSKKTDFIFPLLKNDFDYSDPKVLHKAIASATSYTNKNLGILATKCKINKRIHFHVSRHTFATRALSNGMRMEHVSKLMAHKSIRTTEIYAKIVNKDLDKSMVDFNNSVKPKKVRPVKKAEKKK